MIFDMHVHTVFSPCSDLEIGPLLKRAVREGLDGICITDHGTTAAAGAIDGHPEAEALTVIVGMEYTADGFDFLIFGPVENISWGLGAVELIERVRADGGVAIPAHPFRGLRHSAVEILEHAEIIEAVNGRNSDRANELCRDWCDRYGNGKKMIGGSDAHTLGEVGQVITIFENDILGTDDLVSELRKGNYRTVDTRTAT